MSFRLERIPLVVVLAAASIAAVAAGQQSAPLQGVPPIADAAAFAPFAARIDPYVAKQRSELTSEVGRRDTWG
jgi:hypothetical protein